MQTSHKQNTKANAGQTAHAFKLVKEQVVDLGERIKAASAEAKPALEKELAELMDSIGMQYAGVAGEAEHPLPEGTESKVGAAMLKSFEEANERLAAETGVPTDAPQVELPKVSLWERFKAFIGRNKLKVIGGVTLAVGAVAAYFYRGDISAAINPQGVTVNVEPGVEVPADVAAPSIFSKVGGYFVSAASAVKGYAVSTWNWICNLFTRSAPVVTVDGQAVPA